MYKRVYTADRKRGEEIIFKTSQCIRKHTMKWHTLDIIICYRVGVQKKKVWHNRCLGTRHGRAVRMTNTNTSTRYPVIRATGAVTTVSAPGNGCSGDTWYVFIYLQRVHRLVAFFFRNRLDRTLVRLSFRPIGIWCSLSLELSLARCPPPGVAGNVADRLGTGGGGVCLRASTFAYTARTRPERPVKRSIKNSVKS